ENQAIDQILTIVEGQHPQDFNPFDIEIFDLFPEGLDNSISGRLSQGDISAIVVFNALGQELKTISPRDFDQADPLGHLPAGLYILGMRDQNGQITETVKWMHQ
ncbi:MAG: T9SS type A sorting domain-containing protein, partial [Bacteroidetes bacterium]|nr:T9SS type A sorting domain-containing protein [Bacteroidota bacterium]